MPSCGTSRHRCPLVSPGALPAGCIAVALIRLEIWPTGGAEEGIGESWRKGVRREESVSVGTEGGGTEEGECEGRKEKDREGVGKRLRKRWKGEGQEVGEREEEGVKDRVAD